ncbi:ATP-binding protein [Sulfurimonas sp. SWIR-19]|uniref:HD domain-containing protein n=1 Tax=Sulfurimonas sp. SWIR-19 TaxID=2878390 RepID=UPI001CF387C5|nr:ATP-binding protein [Sulfurimonas sp. SWIR-19]UCN00922.1 ATP-binding protein [Sulfurimonas sp. SWIR-19]
MLKYIENLLYEKTKDTQSQILHTQWSYDKKIIPDILQTISTIFPHYSLHDETHSITIINNIVRVIGKENIEKLSAIDLWLILEASYKHDIGMAITAEDIKNTLKSKNFINFFRDILSDKKHSLYEFASQFKIKNRKIQYKKQQLDLKLHDGIKFLLAEYYRSKHSKRSKKIIENNNQEFDLENSEKLIPKRIFKILGMICDSHTQSFNDVMKLSFSEVGIDTEDAHPRFIACMLRIGDLLDLDNNRFSDVMLRTLHKIPLDTLQHKDKHLSIESFRVDRKIIEIIARCKDYEVANITQHWFNYLNDEISNQMIKWNEIVPSKEFGYLPTIGNLRVELKKYDFIDGKNKPQFKIDTQKALDLLQGAGIYENAYQSIREILQNSVDATLIKIWLEHGEEKNFSTPKSQDFLKLLSYYSITINICEEKVTKNRVIWKIEIEDSGIGISTDDLKFLMTTGSSSKNRKKRNIIEDMPEWMKPSGTFGIGFQSIFMLTEQVVLETKSFFDEQYQIVELNSPSSKKDGAILVEKKDSTHKQKIGTKITFLHQTKKIPNSYSLGRNESLSQKVIASFDPIVDDSFNVEIASLIDSIEVFATKNNIPLGLKFNNENIINNEKDIINNFNYFSQKNSLELSCNYSDYFSTYRNEMFYKNQYIEKDHLNSMKFIGFTINILKDDASEVLTIDRNEIRKKYLKKLNKKIHTSIYEYLIKEYDKIFIDKKTKILASFFLNYYYFEELKKDGLFFDEWKNYKLKCENNTEISLGDLFDKVDKIRFIEVPTTIDNSNFADQYTLKNNVFKVIVYGHSNNVTDFIKKILFRFFKSVKIDIEKNQKSFFKKANLNPIKKKEISNLLEKLNHYYGKRVKIPCNRKYEKLRLKDDARKPWLFEVYVHAYSLLAPSMLSPYFIKDNDKLEYRVTDKIIEWVYENRYDNATTIKEIEDTYKIFEQDMKDAVEKINKSLEN